MDLLNEKNMKKTNKSKAQKLVLELLILSIVFFVLIVGLLFYLKLRPVKKDYVIELNGKKYDEKSLEILTLEDGNKMVPIKKLCEMLGLGYFNGEYNGTLEEKDKGYVNNGINIAQLYADSNVVLKTDETGEKDYEKFFINNNVLNYQERLYIDLTDINVALNLIQYYIEKDNKTVIQTPDYWIENHREEFMETGITISETPENKRGLAYGYVIAGNEEKYGVIDLNKQEIIGAKYDSIEFFEYKKQLIVSNNSQKFGIIDIAGATIIKLQFDDIKVINFEPLLFQVKNSSEYGIMREDGTIINEIKYSSIGYPQEKDNNKLYTLIIPELNANLPKSIVVCQDKKYGLIALENGEEVIPCTLKGIFLYVDVENDVKEYVVQLENGSYNSLVNYMAAMNQITVNMNE